MDNKRKLSVTFNNPLLIKPNISIPKDIAIIGSGTIGPDIGYYLKSALPNTNLYIVDIHKEPLLLAEKRINNYIEKAIKRKKIKPELANDIRKNIVYTIDYEKISCCNLVIEAATENITLKQNIFSHIEQLVSEKTIITSNTSSIPADRIFCKMLNCNRTAVTHFFAPAWRSIPVEVVGWTNTDQETIDFLCWFFALTGKLPISTKNVVCFMLDRIFDNWCNEAAHLLNNISASQIDLVAEEFVHAGPFFVLNMARGNPIIYETNLLQMEEGECYKPAKIFQSVDNWLTHTPGSNFNVPKEIINKVRNRLLGILFSQTFDIIDNEIGTASDLNLGCEIALGFRNGPLDLMKKLGKSRVKKISTKFKEDRPGFPNSKYSFEYYQDFKRFILEDTIDNIKIITIRRPQAMNALNNDVTDEILSVLKQFLNDESIRGFIITGFGNTAFSAGADIGKFPEMLGNYDAAVKYAKECAKVQCFIDTMKKPVVAAINGLALGGGLEIAIRCHGIVADQKSVLQFPEVSLGILPGIGGCIVPYRKWPSGEKIFNEMIMLSKKIYVDIAQKIGMLDGVTVGYDALILEALNIVNKLSKKMKINDKKQHKYFNIKVNVPDNDTLIKANLSYETVSIIADTINSGLKKQNLEDALEIGYRGFGRAACTKSAKEGISAFIEKRKANFNVNLKNN